MKWEKKDFTLYPKFRHNLWTVYDDNPEVTYLLVSHGLYEIPTKDANLFLKFRSFCTGYQTIKEVAEKSSLPESEVRSILDALIKINLIHLPFQELKALNKKSIIRTLELATEIWSTQLADTHISQDIFFGKTSKNVVIGWLLETYHYIKFFPSTLETALMHSSGQLKDLLARYVCEEKGHEAFILQSLLKAGLSQQEIEESVPLVSTRSIYFLLNELFSLEPSTVLLIANIIETKGFYKSETKKISKLLHDIHGFRIDMLDSFFEHAKLDHQLKHHQLLKNNKVLLENIHATHLNDIVNKIHDIKHAFDLQKLEISDYYNKEGNYLPRQYVDFFSI